MYLYTFHSLLAPVRNNPPGALSFTNGANAPRTKLASRNKARFTTGLCQVLSADSLRGGTPS